MKPQVQCTNSTGCPAPLWCPTFIFRVLCERLRWVSTEAARLSGVCAVIALAILAVPTFAAAPSTQVLKIILNDTIQPVTDEFIGRALTEAKNTHADALLIEINTPGGLVDSTREIIEKIVDSPVPVIVYVTPSGSRAASAGFFILESADIAAMARGTNTGAAHPVTIGGDKMDDIMKQKIENDLAAFMRSVAGRRGRNVDVAESAVRQSKSFTEQEALSQKLIDYVATSEDDLFRQIEAKPIQRFDGKTVTLRLSGSTVRLFEMTLKQKILDRLMDPNVAFLLLAVGLLSLYVEFNHPGAVVPGTVGVVFILLAAFALNLLPVRFAALVAIAVAFALFVLEAKFASHGVLTTGGIVLLTLGGLLLVDAPIPEMRVHLLTALAISIPLGLITAFLMTIAFRARRNKVVTGVQGLIGEIGVAQSPLVPEGKVFVHGEIWNAISSAHVPIGTKVVVRRVEGLQLEVSPLLSASENQVVSAVS
jgi:membrane-bound serine protease (ClpP class)